MGGNVQKILSFPKGSSSPVLSGVEGKAAALLTRGAYSQYVSTTKERHLSVRAASAKPGNAADGFSQHSPARITDYDVRCVKK